MHDPAKDVHHHALHAIIAQDNAKRLGDGFLGRTTPDIQEVGRLAAVQLDDVHRGHGQSRSVDQTADVAIQGDITQPELIGAKLRLIFLARVEHLRHVLVAKQRVVIEGELRVDGQHLAVGIFIRRRCHNKRIDLRETRIRIEKQLRQPQHDVDSLTDLLSLEAELERELAGLKRLQPQQRVHRHLVNRFGVLLGNGFDLHSTLG